MEPVIGASPISQLVPVSLTAELAATAFLGIEILAPNGWEMDLDRLTKTIAAVMQLLSGFGALT